VQLSSNIRYLRKKFGMTGDDLAGLLGVKFPAVSGWETGRREPTFTNIEKMAEIFHVSVDKLMTADIESEEAHLKYIDAETAQIAGELVKHPNIKKSLPLLAELDEMPGEEIDKMIDVIRNCKEFLDK